MSLAIRVIDVVIRGLVLPVRPIRQRIYRKEFERAFNIPLRSKNLKSETNALKVLQRLAEAAGRHTAVKQMHQQCSLSQAESLDDFYLHSARLAHLRAVTYADYRRLQMLAVLFRSQIGIPFRIDPDPAAFIKEIERERRPCQLSLAI